MLVDGLQYQFFGVETYLMVNGAYHQGTYTYSGDLNDILSETLIQMTFN